MYLLGPGARAEHQAGFLVFLDKASNDGKGHAQEILNFQAGRVGRAKPDDLGGMPAKHAPFLKVGVLGDNRKAVLFRELPDGLIIRAGQAALMNVSGQRVGIGQSVSQARSEIFVKEKLHALEISNLRSRSAA